MLICRIRYNLYVPVVAFDCVRVYVCDTQTDTQTEIDEVSLYLTYCQIPLPLLWV